MPIRESPITQPSFRASTRAIRPRPRTVIRFLDDEGLIFDSIARKLYSANRTAAFIWCGLEDGLTSDEIAGEVQATFRLPPVTAEHYVEAAIAEWRRLGLVTDGREDIADMAPMDHFHTVAPLGADYGYAPVGRPPEVVAERNCCLLDTCFRIRFGSEAVLAELDPYLAPLVADSTAASALVVDVIEREGLRGLFHRGELFERWVTADQIVPIAKLCLIELALKRSHDFGAVHAAAVYRGERSPCVILPGPSGSGKSTLTAALISRGFQSLGDDTVVFAHDSLDVRAVPFGICLKDGAWKLLASRFPNLAEQPVHDRLDGKRVRYLVPPAVSSPAGPSNRRSARWLVFPTRTDNVRSELVPISRPAALSRLASQFCPLGTGLDLPKVERLMEWIHGVSSYELRCANLDDGVALIEELCG